MYRECRYNKTGATFSIVRSRSTVIRPKEEYHIPESVVVVTTQSESGKSIVLGIS